MEDSMTHHRRYCLDAYTKWPDMHTIKRELNIPLIDAVEIFKTGKAQFEMEKTIKDFQGLKGKVRLKKKGSVHFVTFQEHGKEEFWKFSTPISPEKAEGFFSGFCCNA